MNRKLIKTMVAAICIGCGLYGYFSNTQKEVLTDLVLKNIQALAEEETNGNYLCFGYGDVDCYGDKYDIKIDNLSLRQ